MFVVVAATSRTFCYKLIVLLLLLFSLVFYYYRPPPPWLSICCLSSTIMTIKSKKNLLSSINQPHNPECFVTIFRTGNTEDNKSENKQTLRTY